MVAIVLVAAVLLCAGWLGIRGWMAKGELDDVAALQPRLSAALASGDVGAIGDLVADAQRHAGRAADLTSDPLWRATEAIPGVGANTAAARIMAANVRDIAAAARPVLHAAAPEASAGDGLDLSAMAAAAAPLDDFAVALSRADAELTGIPAENLLGPLRTATERVRGLVDAAVPTVTDAAASARAVPGMLGADGPRTLLVMVQNTAEARAGGGITGSFILLRAERGRISVVDHVDSSVFPRRVDPIMPLPADLVALYGQAPARFVMNATMTPDFTLSARLASAWWQSIGHAAPDAVIAVDPAVLTAMLTVTGPVTLADGTVVDREDVVDDILVRPYLDLTPAEQTAVQRDLIDRLFARITAAPIDPLRWARALAGPVAEGRVSIFSVHGDEQAALGSGPFGGQLARFRAAGADAVGVYVNDATSGKMDTYLHADIAPAVQNCRADGAADVAIAVTLRSTAPMKARAFAESMTGAANPAAPGDITTDVTVMVPRGWFLGGVDIDGADADATEVDGGDPVASLARATLAPGEQKTLTFRFVVKNGTDVRPAVVHTPMMNEVRVAATSLAACG